MKAVAVLMSVRVAEVGNLHGREIIKGTDDEIPAELFDDLEAAGYVAELGGRGKKKADALRDDGPTIADFVAAGYLASNYPPEGYASKSTAKEIAAAVKAEAKANAEVETKLREAMLADLAMLSDEDLAKMADAEKIPVVDGDTKDVIIGKIVDARIAAQG
ncbi:hypothetical protein X739_00550 [Mesorhizobium sp. LNHC220B00]|nr:hypothetical protein [Mesorhizobium sp. LNHC220B00]ESY89026.1 hypothetical protein X739_00550 [Mesorhizobium sp. LNHC220B00]